MTRDEAVLIVRQLLAERVAELENYPIDPDSRTPAAIRRQLHNLGRWREIVNGAELTESDVTDVLILIESELSTRRLAHRFATGPFASFTDEVTAIAAQEWQRLDDVRLVLKLSETAAVLRY